ncbi:cytochrome P450 76T24-like [Arachis duranensis]|uniref:Cytochrome P450 76T24-like n=1 Tax=Arachis duranensis TaxID=130453 RepID=A0A6P4CG17_ARADU|nr:cytochrome P450 76T24-like [Arachis duranensis]
MAELIHSPKKLLKVRKELEESLGKNGEVEESHISKLPYLNAIVKETLRLHPPAPFLVPHKANDDVELGGFTVPKSAQILINVWSIGRDSSVWANPKSFEPERFLDTEIDFKGKNFELIPFGSGRRICPGLPLASRTLNFMLASLLYHFNWKVANEMNPEDIDMSYSYGITLHKAQPLFLVPIKV